MKRRERNGMANARRLWVLLLMTAIGMAAVTPVEARPTDWPFTGYFQVEDPSGNPVAKAPVGPRYNNRWEDTSP